MWRSTMVTITKPLLQSALLMVAILPHLNAQLVIEPLEFYMNAVAGTYDSIIDVRSESEWEAGHIENATFVPNLASMSSIPTDSDIFGCEGQCETIVVYCRSGNRAGVAIQLMLNSGFNGTIYNGQGVSQWTSAGYPLVTTPSVLPRCSAKLATKRQAADPCQLEEGAETIVPTIAPVEAIPPPLALAAVTSGMPSIVTLEVDSAMPSTVTMSGAFAAASPTEEATSGAVSFVGAASILVTSVIACLYF